MSNVVTINGRDLTAQELREQEAVAEADKRHAVLALAALGHDGEGIAVRLAKRPKKQGGPLLLKANEATKIVQTYLERLAHTDAEAIERLRALENRRLDYLMTKLEKGIEAGETGAIKTAIALSERRAKLNGLDAPRKLQHSGKVEHAVVDRSAIEREEEAFRTQHAPAIDSTATETTNGDQAAAEG